MAEVFQLDSASRWDDSNAGRQQFRHAACNSVRESVLECCFAKGLEVWGFLIRGYSASGNAS